MEKLTTRQRATYRLIEQNTEKGVLTRQKDIVANYPYPLHSDGHRYLKTENSSDCCPAIWSDVEKINKSEEIERVIIVKKFTYKIVETEEEAKEFATKYLHDGVKKLKRYWNVVEKMKRNGQANLTEGGIEFIESYLKKEFENDKCIERTNEN